MVKNKLVVIIGAINAALTLEMYCKDYNMVSMTLSYSLFDKVEALVKWSDLWNCLFLFRGKEKVFSLSTPESNLKKVSHLHRRDQLALYFEPYHERNVILIKWKDLKDALLIIRRRWFNDRCLTRIAH